MADVGVRTATRADAAEIARVQVLTWRTAYAGLIPGQTLDAWSQDRVAAAWEAAIASPPTPRHRVLLAHEGPRTVGFASIGPIDDATDLAPHPSPAAEIGTMLIEPRWGRRGHGSRLMAAAADLLREDGFRLVVTWVLEEDSVTGAFLTSSGWEPDGAGRVLDAGDAGLRQYRMHTSLEGVP